jgi:hypothetical protein
VDPERRVRLGGGREDAVRTFLARRDRTYEVPADLLRVRLLEEKLGKKASSGPRMAWHAQPGAGGHPWGRPAVPFEVMLQVRRDEVELATGRWGGAGARTTPYASRAG